MDNTISEQELERRGIGAVEDALREGPVHVLPRDRPRYVIRNEEEYQRLVGQQQAADRLWQRLLADGASGDRSGEEIRHQMSEERNNWDVD